MNIGKFVNPDDKKPFHSSGYAEAANSGAIGSTNAETFGQRRYVDRNRQAVQRYGSAHIASGHRTELNRQQLGNTPLRRAESSTSSVRRQPSSSVLPAPRTVFREPPSRPYNPYS